MHLGLLSDLPDIVAKGVSPAIAVPIALGLLLAIGVVFAVATYRSSDGLKSWQLDLLMATGVALSIASGWTTWDGMKNFTHEPVLALLITFGIQSVLLVTSWLIGESFANRPRMSVPGEVTGEKAEQGFWWLATSFVGIVAGFIALVIVVDDWYAIGLLDGLLGGFRETVLKISVGALAVSLIFGLCLTSGGNLFHSGIGLLRVAAQNASLWVMLFACMGASVFFSFDSLFSTIFPQGERARASDIRTQGKIAELVNDVKARANERRYDRLAQFAHSPQWVAYSKHLDSMIARAERLPTVLETRASEKFREAQSAIGALKVDLVSAQAKLDSLKLQGEGLRNEAAKIRASVEDLAKSQSDAREKIASLEQDISEKAVEAEKELQGLGAGAAAGRGPIYRGLVQARKKLEFELKLVNQRISQLEQQSTASRERLKKTDAAVAAINRRIAKQSVEVDLARKLLDRAQSTTSAAAGSSEAAPLSERMHRLEEVRGEVLQSPSAQAFDNIEQACSALAEEFASSPGSGAQDNQQRCRTENLRAEAAKVDEIAKGLTALEANCTAAGKLPEAGGTGELIAFARRCIQMSGLPSNDMEQLNGIVGQIALNRDDKAHRFVVTINAFNDGNRLAYLALAIALAIDGLVFASGIFYAQAARSPLSDIPGTDGRRQNELEHILESALRPNAPESAAAVLAAIRPHIATESNGASQGFTHEIDTANLNPSTQATIAKLVGVAAAIGAASRSKVDPNCYLLRGEVITYLSRHAYRSKGKQPQYEGVEALQQLLSRVLSDDVPAGAATVLKYMQPMPRRADFATLVTLSEIEDANDTEIVRNVLNAAAVLGYVDVKDGETASQKYLLHRDVFVVLADLAGAAKAASAEADLPAEALPTEGASDVVEAEPEETPKSSENVAENTELEPAAQLTQVQAPEAELEPAAQPAQEAANETEKASSKTRNIASEMQHVGPFEPPGPRQHTFAGQSSLVVAEREALGRTHGRPTAEKTVDKLEDASLGQHQDKTAREPIKRNPQRLEQGSKKKDANAESEASDFGMDLSEPAFPDRLFDALDDDPDFREDSAEEAGTKTRPRRTSVSSE